MLPPQDGHLMSQGDEFELQCEAATNPEREQGTEGGQKREHADDGMTASPKTLCFVGLLEFWVSTSPEAADALLALIHSRKTRLRRPWR